MTPDKTAKLITKYSKIFPEDFWFEYSDGWYDLTDNLCHQIQSFIDSNDNVKQIVASQFKEKFGGLRAYIDPEDGESDIDDNIYQFIRTAEKISETTCETCGKPGKIQTKNYWMKCSCPECVEAKSK